MRLLEKEDVSGKTTGTQIDETLAVLTGIEEDLGIRQDNLTKEFKRLNHFRTRWLSASQYGVEASQKITSNEVKLQVLEWTKEAVSFTEVYNEACSEIKAKLDKLDESLESVVEAKSRLIILDETQRIHADIGASMDSAEGAGFDLEHIQRIISEATTIIETTKEGKEYV